MTRALRCVPHNPGSKEQMYWDIEQRSMDGWRKVAERISEEHARLWAAAPDLLGALESAREAIDGFIDIKDGPGGDGPTELPNWAMSLAGEIDDVLAEVEWRGQDCVLCGKPGGEYRYGPNKAHPGCIQLEENGEVKT